MMFSINILRLSRKMHLIELKIMRIRTNVPLRNSP